MYIVELTYTQPLACVDAHLEAHKIFLERYYATGHFMLSGRKKPRTGGIILADAANLPELEEIIAEDPFQKHGVAAYKITEFLPGRSDHRLAFLLQQHR